MNANVHTLPIATKVQVEGQFISVGESCERTISGKHHNLPVIQKIFRHFSSAVISSFLLFGTHTALAANPASGTTSDGEAVNIEILTPTGGSTLPPASTLEITGKVALNRPITNRTSVVYVVDVSSSTTFPIGAADCNGDGVFDSGDDFASDDNDEDPNYEGSTLDCEVAGVMALNDSLGSSNKVKVGMVAFASRAATAMAFRSSPDRDSDNDGISDIDEYLKDIHIGIEGVGYGTNFDKALVEMVNLFQTRSSNETRIAYFLTDGAASNLNQNFVAAAAAEGITVHTYAIGNSASDCVPSAFIQQIADGTGGTCTEVDDPSALSTVLQADANNPPPGIRNVKVRLNGGANRNATVNSVGEFSYSYSAGALAAGANVIEALVKADDGTTVTADITVTATGSGALCNGYPVTVDISAGQMPTDGDDVILGTSGSDVINALGGNDVICALGGPDIIDGGAGKDWIDAGAGHDEVQGGRNSDVIFGGTGRDDLFGGRGHDEIYGEQHDDNIRGGSGDDVIDGGDGADDLRGNSGDDDISGGGGSSDSCNGGGGTDTAAASCETTSNVP